MNEEGLNLIKEFEDFKSKPYQDPAGYWTIGYGHLIWYGNRRLKGSKDRDIAYEMYSTPISPTIGIDLLTTDLFETARELDRVLKIRLNENQYSALISFTFNLGIGNVSRSTLLRKVNNQQFNEVPAEFVRWVYAGGKKLNGLVKRRNAEAKLFMKGI